MSPAGVLTTLYTFTSLQSTRGPLIQARDGNFYGATATLSPLTNGTLFRLTPSGEYALLHTFTGYAGTSGGLLEASNGLLYGATETGEGCANNHAAIYTLSIAGQYNEIYEFGCQTDGSGSGSGLTEASDGYLYGVTRAGGLYGGGSLFRLLPDGSGFTTLVNLFDAIPQTIGPGVIQGSDGALYGMVPGGGEYGEGFVYKEVVGAPPPLPILNYTRPPSAAPGTTILIRGANFLAASGVTFNGIPATFQVRSVDYIEAVVPAGATTGPITVTTPNGSGTATFSFTVE